MTIGDLNLHILDIQPIQHLPTHRNRGMDNIII
jgi:hypothetical protein